MIAFPTLSLITPFPDHAIWTGIGVSVSVAVLVAWRWSRQRPSDAPVLTLGESTETRVRESSDYWEELPSPAENRRSAPRRHGNPTAIQVIGPDGKNRQNGCVIDRNSGGLRLAIQHAPQNGTELLLRAGNAPPGTPWVRATVCWVNTDARPNEVGCRFSDRVPWNILLLFG